MVVVVVVDLDGDGDGDVEVDASFDATAAPWPMYSPMLGFQRLDVAAMPTAPIS